eukprot:CAMPEP_0172325600 /NCGR_PEP_ID=MMETSP1058-20130122/54452_1 /TAXON_ID=83371 /ORGANISM="Detonula confervacea, Strain CCMP 353" /LENGTH=643 /DNA_ID=CAMNT_0013042189 /DNA_START=85 /DNA_END=2016 /DNA_ORIENTATION=-
MSMSLLVWRWLVCLAFIPPAHTFLAPPPRAVTNNISRHGRLQSLPPNLESLVADTIDSDRKIIVVTGGVLSGIGKGVTASSIGVLFRAMGYRVTALKIDPYLNVDAGTMSPFEHGEVFVLDDGGETDLDLGNYERFLSVSLTKESNLSTGKIYQSVIERERIGEYLGKTVQVVPHVSDAIQEWILRVAKTPVSRFSKSSSESKNSTDEPPEVCIVELGGTLGDIESMPFVEALRQLQENLGYKNLCFCHVSLVPNMGEPPEQKTKPTQHSVKQMMSMGLRPDFLCCRGSAPLDEKTVSKLSMFTSVPKGAVLSLHDVSNIYRVPLMMIEQNLPSMILQRLRMGPFQKGYDYSTGGQTDIEDSVVIQDWKKLADSVDEPESECVIAVVGKYIDQGDAYLSVVKALTHAAIGTKQRLRIEWIEASSLNPTDDDEQVNKTSSWERLKECDGVVVPGGFGSRGMEGKISTIQFCRETGKPFLGICLGMQAAVIEYCRNKLGIEKAHSAEFFSDLVKDEEDAVIFMPEGDRERMGGTMRLGARETILKEGSIARSLYGKEKVMERHRHRYEVNPALVARLEEAGLQFSGRNTDASGERMEVVELSEKSHPYFVAAQFHPEFTSRPELPSPLFLGLLQACKTIIASDEV